MKNRNYKAVSEDPYAGTQFEASWIRHPDEGGQEVIAFQTHSDVEDRILNHLSNELGYVYHDPKYNFMFIKPQDSDRFKKELEKRQIYIPMDLLTEASAMLPARRARLKALGRKAPSLTDTIDINGNEYVVQVYSVSGEAAGKVDEAVKIWDVTIHPKGGPQGYFMGHFFKIRSGYTDCATAEDAKAEFLFGHRHNPNMPSLPAAGNLTPEIMALAEKYESWKSSKETGDKALSDIMKKRKLPKSGPVKKYTPEEIAAFESKQASREMRKLAMLTVEADAALKNMFEQIMSSIDQGHLDEAKAASLRETMQHALMNWLAEHRDSNIRETTMTQARALRIKTAEECMGKDKLEVDVCDVCKKDPCVCEEVKASSKRALRLAALNKIGDYDDDDGGYDGGYDEGYDEGYGDYLNDVIGDLAAAIESRDENAMRNVISKLDSKTSKIVMANIDNDLPEGTDSSRVKQLLQERITAADTEDQNKPVFVNLFFGTNHMRTWQDGGEGGRDSRFEATQYKGSMASTAAEADDLGYRLIEMYSKKAGLEDFVSDANMAEFGGAAGGVNESHDSFAFTVTDEPQKQYFEKRGSRKTKTIKSRRNIRQAALNKIGQIGAPLNEGATWQEENEKNKKDLAETQKLVQKNQPKSLWGKPSAPVMAKDELEVKDKRASRLNVLKSIEA